MTNDQQTYQEVANELRRDERLDASAVSIAVHDGIVILTGLVRCHAERVALERDVLRIASVHAIANELQVRVVSGHERDDDSIAAKCLETLESSCGVPNNNLKVVVTHGYVHMKGEVGWDFQRGVAEQVVRRVEGVRGVWNAITIKRIASQPLEKCSEGRFEVWSERGVERDHDHCRR